MDNITFITAANKNYESQALGFRENMEEHRVNYRVFDIGGLGFGTEFPWHDEMLHKYGFSINLFGVWESKAIFKPFVVLEAFEYVKEGDIVIWLDANARLRRQLYLENEFDIGAVIRGNQDRSKTPLVNLIKGDYNAGVAVFRKNEKSIDFVKRWGYLTRELGNDQWAFNTLIDRNWGSLNILTLIPEYNDDDDHRYTFITHAKGKHAKQL